MVTVMLKKICLTLLTVFVYQVNALECPEEQRVFSDKLSVLGDLCVPNKPQRIVSMDMSASELTLFTGKELLGTANWILAEMSVLSPELSDELKNVENVGYPTNLEKVLTLKPDLIVAVSSATGDISQSIDIKRAQKIAPVIIADTVVYDDWKTSTKFWGKALGVEPTVEKMLANYQMRLDEVKAELGDKTNQTVSIIAVSTYGKSLWLKDTPPAKIVADLGFSRPKSQDYDRNTAKGVYQDVRYPMISEEKLNLADGDIIFGFGYPAHEKRQIDKTAKLVEKMRSDALWKSLKGVKNNQFHLVSGHWWRCTSYLLANKVLSDISERLTGKKPATAMLSPQ